MVEEKSKFSGTHPGPPPQGKAKNVAVIVAGGTGKRMGSDTPKQFLMLGHGANRKMVLSHTIERFVNHPEIDHVCVVIHPDYTHFLPDIISDDDIVIEPSYADCFDETVISICYGGAERHDSVHAGLLHVHDMQPSNVLIHDAARPFVSATIISDVLAELQHESAVLPIVPSIDTLKTVFNQVVKETVDRSHIFGAQTPQGFDYKTIFALHKQQQKTQSPITDDISLCENTHITIKTVAGCRTNFKITTQEDLNYAHYLVGEATMKASMPEFRIGNGFDVHAFDGGEKDHVIIGGITIEHHEGLQGHSDADVALHALVDAILGALGMGDIGTFFPPSDPQWKGVDSAIFVEHSRQLLLEKRAEIGNIDITIMCEAPKITPHRAAMKANIAKLLHIDEERVNIAATTTEKLGFLGRKEGIAAQASILITLPLQ